jgi:murein DD-endopeptidase MepM/ murein hydrolase activator NlpD
MRIHNLFVVLLLVFSILSLSSGISLVSAEQSEIDKLKAEIDTRSARLNEIEKEIAGYKADLQKVGAEKNTLQKAINQLELERKKVQADISYTQNKISSADLMISKLTIEITDTEESIKENESAIAESLRLLQRADDESLVEVLLQHSNLSDFWKQVDELETLRGVVGNRVRGLVSERKLLEEKHIETTEYRGDLVDLKQQYSEQNNVLVSNKTEKDKLLSATKSEEAEYQKLLKEKEVAKELIIKEMRDFESKLLFILDPTTVPPKGIPVFDWPLENVIITQLFGGTEFAKQNASVYGGRAYHPGVDFGAPRGTPILAPLSGTVRATGDTDAVPGCYSWGKWTLIDHANGLSTLYAHQSVQSVAPGQSVKTGETIGYVGNTGYSTGPHLHFTVYAKAGVNVRKFNEIKTVTSCGAATTPVAATDAYIDPMVYLPAQ